MIPSAAYVGMRPRWYLSPVSFLGWLLLLAAVGLVRAADRLHDDMGQPSWTDVIGGVIFIPLAFALCFSLMLGRDALVQLLLLLPKVRP